MDSKPRLLVVLIGAGSLIAGCVAAPVGQGGPTTHPAASATTEPSTFSPPAAEIAGAFPKVTAEARWPEYGTVAALTRAADVIVLGHITGVGPGRSIPGPASLPFTNATLVVNRVAKGPLSPGATIVVEQTGGFYVSSTVQDLQRLPRATPPAGAGPGVGAYPRPSPGSEYVFVEVEGDPLFFVREETVLFLRWKAELGVYQIVGPQGRFRVLGDRVQAMWPSDRVVGRFQGDTVNAVFREVTSQ